MKRAPLLRSSSSLPGPPVVNLSSPPMGFMSWERFQCEVNCTAFPNACINEELYQTSADALIRYGFADVGYTLVAVDDCWTDLEQGRDPITTQLRADPQRFSRGMKALGDYIHSLGLQYGMYADAGTTTCAGYEGSWGYEDIDVQTFADWGVDYLKLDACAMRNSQMEQGFTSFGNALKDVAGSQPMVYSCCWPVYVGDNETQKIPIYETMYKKSGCNTWRNFHFIDNGWDRLYYVIQHWAKYWKELKSIPNGAFNDADMLLVGDDHHGRRLPVHQAQLQMGFWSMISSPLFIGGDIRIMPEDYRRILLNEHIIAINQDVGRHQANCVAGCHIDETTGNISNIQIWSKELQDKRSRAFAFFNLNSDTSGNETPAATIVLQYPLNRGVARCVDLWSDQPEQDICHQDKGNKSQDWEIQFGLKENKNGTVKHSIVIKALNVPTTSHRMLRIDFYCNNDNNIQRDVHGNSLFLS